MPELPEVEVLVRHLEPLLRNRSIRSVEVRRARVLRPTSVRHLARALTGARLCGLTRRGESLVFRIRPRGEPNPTFLVGHLGMTGRMYLLPKERALPKHAAVVLDLGKERFVFEDTRYFGRFTLERSALDALGPEPLGSEFTPRQLMDGLARSDQPVKVRLLDQSLVAGIGNIYASEALFGARISPLLSGRGLTPRLARALWKAIRKTLFAAIEFGSTVSLDYAGLEARGERLFYYGSAEDKSGGPQNREERLLVYDRAGQPCFRCGTKIKRIVQAGRSTFYCPKCQTGG